MGPENRFRKYMVDPFLATLKHTFVDNINQKAKKGSPDYYLCIRGDFIGLEVKSTRGGPNNLQIYMLDKIETAGGRSIVARPQNWELVKDMLIKLDGGHYGYDQIELFPSWRKLFSGIDKKTKNDAT